MTVVAVYLVITFGLGGLAMALGFILTGSAGLLGLWWAMGDELFIALQVAFARFL